MLSDNCKGEIFAVIKILPITNINPLIPYKLAKTNH